MVGRSPSPTLATITGDSDVPISLFRSVVDTVPSETVSVSAILRFIRDGEFRTEITRLRTIANEAHTAYIARNGTGAKTAAERRYDSLKKTLPAVTFSGEFGTRRAVGLLRHSGFLCFDVDHADDSGELRRTIASDPYTYAAFLSPSGHGVKWLVSIDPGAHETTFDQLAGYYQSCYGVNVDRACRDITRLCFISYDPDLTVSPDARLFSGVASGHFTVTEPQDTAQASPVHFSTTPSPDDVRELLSFIRQRPDYLTWVRIISAVANTLPESDALAVLTEWMPEEQPGEYARKIAARLRHVGFGTLVHLAREHGYLPRRTPVNRRMAEQPFRDVVMDVAEVTGVTDVTGSCRVFPSITARELQRKEFAEPQWIIPDLLPVGLAILAGRPKAGKSWLALNIALAVAGGRLILGVFDTEQAGTLYLALEDNERRLQQRMKSILSAERASAPEGLHFMTTFARFDDGGFDDLETFLRTHPDVRLVIIDTLQRLRGRRKSQDTYAGDYDELGRLQSIALKHGVAVLLVHHTTKMNYADPFDSISGTTGITGSADTLFVLVRSPELNGVALHTRGRDIDEQSLAVTFDKTTGVWTSRGDVATVKLSEQRRAILDLLNDGGSLGPREIAEATGLSYDAVRQMLRRMVNAGEIASPGRGKYKLPVTTVTSGTSDTTVTSVPSAAEDTSPADGGAQLPVTTVTSDASDTTITTITPGTEGDDREEFVI